MSAGAVEVTEPGDAKGQTDVSADSGPELLEAALALADKDRGMHELLRSKGDVSVRVVSQARPYVAATLLAAGEPAAAPTGDSTGERRRAVLFCAGQRDAERWAADLAAFGIPARLLPPWDTLPAERLAPAVEIVAARMAALDALEDARAVAIVPARAALLPVPCPNEGLHRGVTMTAGDELPMETLVARLHSLGFSREAKVEKQGEFAVRGGIVDCYPPGLPAPVRIEFFGDEIESLRHFDVITQVTHVAAESVELQALSEIRLLGDDGLPSPGAVQAATLLSEELEINEWLRADVDRLSAGEYFEGVEAYVPFIYGFRGRVSDYLDADSLILIDEPKAFSDECVRILREEGSYLLEAQSSRAIPQPPVPYFPLTELIDPDEIVALAAQGKGLTTALKDVLGYVQGSTCRSTRSPDMAEGSQAGVPAGPGSNATSSTDSGVTSSATSVARTVAMHSFTLPGLPGDDIEVEAEPTVIVSRDHEVVSGTIDRWLKAKKKVVIASSGVEPARRVTEFLKSLGLPAVNWESREIEGSATLSAPLTVGVGSLESGFQLPGAGLVVVTQHDLMGSAVRRDSRRATLDIDPSVLRPLRSLSELEHGDICVHLNHGLCRYEGLTRRTVDGITREYLLLHFDGKDKVFLPVDSLDRITKYMGGGDAPRLSRLGGKEWLRAKTKVRKSVRKLAMNLVKLYAERARAQGHKYADDTPWQRELEESFPYQETPDQYRAIVEVKEDMEAKRPMDRLVCGDVGFGKTEVALRAAFKAVMDHRQVLVLVPTTLLAQQHFATFTERFEPFPVRVELLSRFRSTAEQNKVIKDYNDGAVDVVVGTHRVLSKDLKAKNLGLIIMDEEHRFGVGQKEQLKEMRRNVDVLAMSATPIPRTLQMSLSGIRDMTTIETPPPDRQPILTFSGEYESTLVRAAIRRELAREGQVYYVHNRVSDIEHVAVRLRELIPEARICVGHGQMSEKELDVIMRAFTAREYDILLSTTIIESGIDIPNANTMLVEQADTFGLAQLYQLRGRVGRSGRRAYAYFLTTPGKTLTIGGEGRLKAMGELTTLGSGLKIAMRDLEIRGAGDLLGGEQSGHVAEVGFELYAELLRQEVEEVRKAAMAGLVEEGLAEDIVAGFKEAARQVGAGAAGGAGAGGADGGANGSAAADLGDIFERPEIRVELPVEAYIPESYVDDETLRIEAYARIARIRDIKDTEDVTTELRDRYGKPPAEVETLIAVCRLRAMAAEAGIEKVAYALPRGISGGRLSIFPLVMTTALWDRVRKRFGAFEWKRLERTAEFSDVPREEVLRRAQEIVEELAKNMKR